MVEEETAIKLNVLTDMVNRLLCDRAFPSCWKSARVTSIFKGGSIESPSNLRPIFILSVLSQLFEKTYQITFTIPHDRE